MSHIMGPRASQDLRSPSPIMAPGQSHIDCITSFEKKEEAKEASCNAFALSVGLYLKVVAKFLNCRVQPRIYITSLVKDSYVQ